MFDEQLVDRLGEIARSSRCAGKACSDRVVVRPDGRPCLGRAHPGQYREQLDLASPLRGPLPQHPQPFLFVEEQEHSCVEGVDRFEAPDADQFRRRILSEVSSSDVEASGGE